MRKGKPPKNIRSSIAPSLRTRQNENQTDSDWDCPAPAPTLSCLHGLLSKHPGNCKFPHGHTRSVEMVFRAETLDANDMVLDFKAIKQMMGDFLQQFDHSLCVNTEDPNFAAFVAAYGERIIPFDREDPTSEVMARVIFNVARHALEKARENPGEYPVRACVELERVRVWETSSSWAEYGE